MAGPVAVTSFFLVLFHGTQHVVQGGVSNENVAFGKPATQSSTKSGYIATRAVDGSSQPYVPYGWCSQTWNFDAWTWWMVDLQSDYTIESIRLTSRLEPCCPDDLNNLVIEVSTDDPATLPGYPQRTTADVCLSLIGPVPTNAPTAYACDQPVTGRYIRVVRENSDNMFLSICEFEAFPYVETNATYFPPSPYNLALNKPSSQSSDLFINDNSDGGFAVASRASDGNLDGLFSSESCTHTIGTGTNSPHWWMVDLEDNFSVFSVRMVGRTDCCQFHLKNFRIEVSEEDPSTLPGYPGYTTASVCTTQVDILPHIRPVTLLCDQIVLGRYVRVILIGRQLNLCEVEVLEEPPPPPPSTEAPKVFWRFAYVTGKGGGNSPHSMAAQRLMTNCARRRYRGSKDITENPYIYVDLNSGACSFHQTVSGSLGDAVNDWVVYKLE